MDRILFRGFVWGAPHSPLLACGTEKLKPVDERVMFGRIKLRDAGLSEVFELHFTAHELAHVILEGFGTECNFRRIWMHASWRTSQ